MSETKTVKERIQGWFSKQNIPLKIVEDLTKPRLDALIAFKAAEPGTIELKCEDVKTTDGLMITIEPAIEVGAACVSVVEGVAEPLPPEKYVLEDGRTIVVKEPGIIAEVIEKEEDTPPPADPPVDETQLAETNAKVTRLIEQVSKITEFNAAQTKKLETVEAKFAALQKKHNEMIEGLNSFKSDTKDLLEEVFSEAATEPVVKPKDPLKKEEPKKTWKNALN